MTPRQGWSLTKQSVVAFMEDGALSKGAAIAFYAVTAIGPILLIIVAIVGLGYGDDAARGALLDKLRGVMGEQSASFLQSAIKSASSHGAGVAATIIGVISLVLTATGVFGEIQTALNAIWRAQPKGSTLRQLLRTRLVSLGLVAVLALVLILSLVLSAVVSGLQNFLNEVLPFSALLIEAANFLLSFVPVSRRDCRDLQDPAGSRPGLGRRDVRGHRHGVVDHARQAGDWILYRQQRHNLRLWRCWFRHRGIVLDLLLGADFLARRRVHAGFCRARGQDHAFTCRISAAQRSRIGST